MIDEEFLLNPPRGRYTGLSNADYHAGAGISKSGMDRLAISPEHYRSYLTEPRGETEAMRVGSALHKLVLEPDTFSLEFAVAPEGLDRRKSADKAIYAEFERENAGKTVLAPDEFALAEAMANSIRRRKLPSAAIKSYGEAEVSFYWNDPALGTLCKCRPDYLRADNYIVDIKTTKDARPASFERSAENYRYYVQAAFYIQGAEAVTGEKVKDFLFIAVEKSPPYAVACYFADESMIQAGNEEVRRCLTLYEECVRTGVWPGLDGIPVRLSRPRWAA
jgi:hypothetical protein